jgi:glycopeptide antibiotics resistance protein
MVFDRYRWVLLLHVLLLPLIGYAVRFSAVLPEWLRNTGGNIAYEMLWIFVVLSLFPRLLPRGVAIGVCLVTFGLEFLQLVQHPILVAARSTLPGRLILGNGFIWEDFPLYVLGSGIGWWWASRVRRWFGRLSS